MSSPRSGPGTIRRLEPADVERQPHRPHTPEDIVLVLREHAPLRELIHVEYLRH